MAAGQDIFSSIFALESLRIVILVFLILYAIFALLVVKQISIVGKILITPRTSFIKAFAIIHAGFAIGFVLLGFGLL